MRRGGICCLRMGGRPQRHDTAQGLLSRKKLTVWVMREALPIICTSQLSLEIPRSIWSIWHFGKPWGAEPLEQ